MSRPARRFALVGALTFAGVALAACASATAPGGFAPGEDRGFIPGGSYVLVGMDGKTVPLRNVTLVVEENRLSGQAPCNGYSATNNAELPAIALSPIVATKVACKDMKLETRFLSVLQQANSADFYGGVLRVKSPSTWLIFERGMRDTSGVSALEQARGTQ